MIAMNAPSHDSTYEEQTAVLPRAELVDDDPICIDVVASGKDVQFLLQLDQPIATATERILLEEQYRSRIGMFLQQCTTIRGTMRRLLRLDHVKNVSVLLASMPPEPRNDTESTEIEHPDHP